MSIFNTSNLIGGAAGASPGTLVATASPNLSGQSTLVLSSQTNTFQAPLTFATFYTGGATFNGLYGKFVKA
jgi:hypothetical protein